MFRFGITAPGARFDCSTVEGVEYAAACGVDGIEFYNPDDVDFSALEAAAVDHGIEVFGTLAGGAGSNNGFPDQPAITDPQDHATAVADIEASIETASEIGCEVLVVTVGPDQERIDRATQHNAIVRVLREVATTAEAHGVTIVLEPLNRRVNHPGYYLTTSTEGVSLIEAVNSPRVKLLFDVYHQQITEGDVIRRLREYSEYIGHIHIADNPGRHEPGTGELNYEAILGAIADLDYDGYVSCEFQLRGEPEEVFRRLVDMADEARS